MPMKLILIQIICPQLYAFQYPNVIEIIGTQFYGFKYFHQIIDSI